MSVNYKAVGVVADVESQNLEMVPQEFSWKIQEKHSIVWEGLSWEVDLKSVTGQVTGTRKILDNVHGHVMSTEMLAIMGPSGCGKTSLLEILANRSGNGRFGGKVTIDNKPISRDFSPSYVAQEDTLLGSFTTFETMMYTAALTLPYDIGKEERKRKVHGLIKDLGLEVCEKTLVGDIFRRGLSGGQKRRLSLGLALMSHPSILLLDEPTSGLDAASSFEIMQLLSTLCTTRGLAIAATIHQPSSDLWALFDRLCLLSKGRLVYFGKAKEAVPYFASIGHPCPEFSNPADFFLGLINTDFPGHADITMLAQNCTDKLLPDVNTEIRLLAAANTSSSTPPKQNPNPFWWHFIVLMHRNLLNTARNPGVIGVRLVMYVMLSVMIGAMFLWNGNKSTDKAIQARISALFFIFAFMVFMSIAVLPFYMMDRATYFRERFNGDYSVFPFVLAQFISTQPGVFFIAFMSSIVVVFMMKLQHFGMFLLLLYLSLATAEGFMAVVATLVPHFIIGIAAGAGLYGFFMLCEGFFQIKSDIPPWFIWVYYMGFHTYAFRGSMVNEFEDRGVLKDATNPNWATGKDVINYYDMQNVSPSDDAWVLFGYAIAWQVLLYFILEFYITGKR